MIALTAEHLLARWCAGVLAPEPRWRLDEQPLPAVGRVAQHRPATIATRPARPARVVPSLGVGRA